MKKQIVSKPIVAVGVAFASTNFGTHAAIVQIDLTNNQITGNGGNQLFADIDFDGLGDIAFTDPQFSIFIDGFENEYSGRVRINGNLNLGRYGTFANTQTFIVDGNSGVNGWVPVTINSSKIGNHQGFLEIRINSNSSAAGVYIERFVFDDASATTDIGDLDLNRAETSIGVTSAISSTVSAVPEPTSLALLAAGAGGLMLRRRREKKSA